MRKVLGIGQVTPCSTVMFTGPMYGNVYLMVMFVMGSRSGIQGAERSTFKTERAERAGEIFFETSEMIEVVGSGSGG